MMLSALLGPFGGFLSMVVILAVQCLLFADGGLLALGANCINMAFYGCFVGYFVFWRPIVSSKAFTKYGERKAARIRVAIASIAGSVLTLQLGALSVVIETSLSGITELPFGAFAMLMQPIHLAIGLVEGLVTAAVLIYVLEARPELLMELDSNGRNIPARYKMRSAIATLGIAALLVGGGLSLLASSKPDGLEWALFGNEEEGYSSNMGLDEDDYGIIGSAAETAARVQEATAVLPDYAFKGSESPVGTTVSGIAGGAICAILAGGACALASHIGRKKKRVSEENA